jgi:dTMP kinase
MEMTNDVAGNMASGIFISLDGLDGSGKSMQCRLLADWLRQHGRTVTECADPGGTQIGNMLRELLLDRRREMTLACEAFLFLASRAQLTEEIIRPALEAGHDVVSDRFLLANVVYQGHAGGIEPGRLWEMGRLATDGLEPDLTLVLDLPAAEALSRRGRRMDRMESRDLEFHERVRSGFLREAAERPERVRIVKADAPVSSVHQHICQEVERVLEAHSRA